MAAGQAPQVQCSGAGAPVRARSLQRAHRADAAAAQPQPGVPFTLWLKHKTEDNQWTRIFSKSVDPSFTVDAFIQRLVSKEELRVRPSHVTLLWPSCLPDALDTSKEAEAQPLKPWQTLRAAGIQDGHVLLADIHSAAQGVVLGVLGCGPGVLRRGCVLRVCSRQGSRVSCCEHLCRARSGTAACGQPFDAPVPPTPLPLQTSTWRSASRAWSCCSNNRGARTCFLPPRWRRRTATRWTPASSSPRLL